MSRVLLLPSEHAPRSATAAWCRRVASALQAEVVGDAADDQQEPALVVVEIAEHGSPSADRQRDLLGSLIARSSSPIVVLPPVDWTDDGPMMVGVDGSEHNAVVFRWARWWSAQLDRRLIAVYVADPIDQTYTLPGQLTPEEIAVRNETAYTGAEFVERPDTDVAGSLLEYADIRNVSCVVIGVLTRHTLGGRRLGRVTSKVLAETVRPLVILPRSFTLD